MFLDLTGSVEFFYLRAPMLIMMMTWFMFKGPTSTNMQRQYMCGGAVQKEEVEEREAGKLMASSNKPQKIRQQCF